MRILSCCAYRGKNIYSHKPVIKMNIELGEYYDVATNEIEGFNDSLIKLLPGLYKQQLFKGL